MSGFLDYLDEFNKKNNTEFLKKNVVKEKKLETKKLSNLNSNVLSLNVEVRTAEGAQVVIEKIQEWVFKQNNTFSIKKTFRIPPKKISKNIEESKNPIVVVRSHAMDILDGLPDDPQENIIPITEGNINNNIKSQTQFQTKQQLNLDSVAGHASALL